MNEYIFYTTEGTTHSPQENQEIENCQVLGCATGNNIEDAKNNLLQDNTWISESGFNIDKAVAKQLVTENVRHNIHTIVEYLLQNKFLYTQEQQETKNIISQALYQLKKTVD